MCVWVLFLSMLLFECGLYVYIHVLFWHFCQSIRWVQPSNKSGLSLLLECTAGSAPQHLASLTQNASSSSRRVSPLCSTDLIAALSRNQVEALWVNKTVQWRPWVKSPVPLLEERRNSSVFRLKTCLSAVIAWPFEYLSDSLAAFLSFELLSSWLFARTYQAGMFSVTFPCIYRFLTDNMKKQKQKLRYQVNVIPSIYWW